MRRFRFFLVSLLAITVAGCAGAQSQNGGPPTVTARALLSMAHYVPLSVHADRRPSYMQPDAGKKSALIYVGDWATNDVDVYDYVSGEQVGTLTGFSEPYGMCVDAKGDVYIANFGAGTTVEYKHGGQSPINTYSGVGEPIGCSVDAKGDVAVTSFSPGEVVVFAGGNPSKSTTYAGACTYQWTMGYDDKDDLVGVGEESTGAITACALLSGLKSIITLGGCCLNSSGMTITFPGGTTWDGKYLAIGDQEAGGTFRTGIYQATLSGETLIEKGETILTDDCYSDYADVVNPFIVGKKNGPANRKQGKVVVGPNLWCNDAGGSDVEFWHYPSGKALRHLNAAPSEPYGTAVSLKVKSP